MMRFSGLYFWLRIRLFFKQKSTYKIPAVRGRNSSPEIDSVARGSETLCDGKQEVPQSYIFIAYPSMRIAAQSPIAKLKVLSSFSARSNQVGKSSNPSTDRIAPGIAYSYVANTGHARQICGSQIENFGFTSDPSFWLHKSAYLARCKQLSQRPQIAAPQKMFDWGYV